MRIPKNISTMISLVLSYLLLAALTVGLFIIPTVMRCYIQLLGKSDWIFLPGVINLYTALLPAFCADISLLVLLNNIRRGEVFIDRNVSCLRILSWCCFAESLIFLAFGLYFLISIAVAFAAAFLGVILRVVKNVIEEAVSIKNENDFTI